MVPALIFSIICFSFILVKAAGWVIIALRRISKMTKTGVFALSLVILALGTSLPELFVGVTSALEKSPALSLGNVIGANIANVSLVAGLTALILGRVNINQEYIRRDVLVAFIAGLLPLLLVVDASLSRVDGMILLAAYGAYSTSLFKTGFERIAKEHQKEGFIYRFFKKFANIDGHHRKEIGRLFIGLGLLLFSADMIVRMAEILGQKAGIPIILIGIVVLSIGTTLPEITFSFRSVEDHQPTMFLGNLLGSIIANSTLIIGITSLIYPIQIIALENYYLAAATFIIIYGLFWIFVKTKQRLDRWEGGVLFLIYLMFVVVQLLV